MLLRMGMLCFLSYLIACSSSKKTANTPTINAGRSDSLTGMEIIAKSDCLICHKIEEKLIGPSYKSIAAKYELTVGNIDKLSKKIINGGYGPWGGVPMTPHPALSEEDAKTMVKYILLLKN